jgi:hypothetical protein
MGGRQLPPLIELRTDKLGTTLYRPFTPLYRPFTPNSPRSDPRVAVVVNQTQDRGWKLAGNLITINFNPPCKMC